LGAGRSEVSIPQFEKQEGQIDEIQASIKKLQDEELRHRQTYENYLGSLDVE